METQKDFSARLATVKAEIRAARAFLDQFDADGKPVSYTRAVEAPEFFDAFEFETVDSLEFNLALGSF